MPACTTPLLWPLWWAATSASRSNTATRRPGRRERSSRAVARPTMPAPTTARSHSAGGVSRLSMGCHDAASMTAITASPPAFGLFVGGRWRDAGRELENRNPARPDAVVSTHALAGPAEVDEAYAAARAAAPGWRRTPPLQRGQVLFRAAELLEQRAEAIAAELTAEEGKTLPEARGEADRPAALLRHFARQRARPRGG